MNHDKIFITVIGLVFLALAALFTLLPRSTFSELERRELAPFPDFTFDRLKSGEWTGSVSSWFSDTEPFRDEFMTLSMKIKGRMAIPHTFGSEDRISFHASDDSPAPAVELTEEHDEEHTDSMVIDDYKNTITAAEENAKVRSSGILVIGTPPTARALMLYGGSSKSGAGYAGAANAYKERFGDSVNVYCMVIPNSIEYYCPDKARNLTSPMLPTIRNIHSLLDEQVKPVDVYSVLGSHASEPIFLRTDHHWAPLGAYYAARKFAEVAQVPFMDIAQYRPDTVKNFVGTMYGYSKDIAVKESPEDFVYYVPQGVDYTTTYIDYQVDEAFKVTGEGKPYKGKFFYRFKNGSGGAYCTFMGGDMKITKVETSTSNSRRLLILKDSFGNALPGYLFGSFEEIHVVDCRYFTRNMTAYVRDNGITDILFANNIFQCCSQSLGKKYLRFLDQ